MFTNTSGVVLAKTHSEKQCTCACIDKSACTKSTFTLGYVFCKDAAALERSAGVLLVRYKWCPAAANAFAMAKPIPLEAQLNANLLSAYHLTRDLLPSMMKAKQGHIFNICSIASLQAYPHGGSYSISKYALLGFSKNLRLELKDKGIKVTAVCPGATYTNSWKGSGVPEDRIMEADDIAKMIYAATQLSPQAVVEDIVLRPQLGDL